MFNSWSSLFYTVLTASLGYVIIVFLMRISGKRTLSKWNSFDFVVTIAFGSILASMILSKDTSLVQASLGFALLILFQFLITWVAVRSSVIQNLVKAKPTLLFYKGQFRKDALKNERVTQGEISAAIRSQGIGDLSEADAVILETDGSFSVIKNLKDASALWDVQNYSSSLER